MKHVKRYLIYAALIICLLYNVIFKSSNTVVDNTSHFEETLLGIEDYSHGIRLGKWNDSSIHIPFNEVWGHVITMLKLPTRCNAVDIGANDGNIDSRVVTLDIKSVIAGDTSLNLAVATGGGTVVAFEMGPPVQLLRFNAL